MQNQIKIVLSYFSNNQIYPNPKMEKSTGITVLSILRRIGIKIPA